jgi:hypothetical protein
VTDVTNNHRATLLIAATLALAACGPPPPEAPAPVPAEGAAAQAGPPPAAATPAEPPAPGTLTARPGLLRPVPNPIPVPRGLVEAEARGTRTPRGAPGPAYWQQHAHYRIEARLDPAAARVDGRATIRYENRSPHTLPGVLLHLRQNLHAPDALRNRPVPVTDGVTLRSVRAQARTLASLATAPPGGAGYYVDGTVAVVRLPSPLAPGQTAELELEWSYPVPPQGAPRNGQDGEVFMIAYWYPQLAVLDDVDGWVADPYMGNAEFYMGFADYDVAVTLPEGWLVAGTGTLLNDGEVLTTRTRERLEQARRTGVVVQVVAAGERGAGSATARGAAPGAAGAAGATSPGTLTWRFRAENVRDFVFAASDRYVWDATRALVGSGDTVAIHALYRPGTPSWEHAARLTRMAIEEFSRELWPYPWPHMTSVEGLLMGGMEYPMMTLMAGPRDTVGLASLTLHEVAHMWFPMLAGSDEKRYPWLDEGLASYLTQEAMRRIFPGYDPRPGIRNQYLNLVASGREVPLMRHGDLWPDREIYGAAVYDKISLVLGALEGLIGPETFQRALREFGTRWSLRHPTPWDFFRTVEDVSGRDLSWFWRSWFFETWTLDQAVARVTAGPAGTEIVIQDRGEVPMPVPLAITRADGTTERREIPVDVWLAGAREHTVTVGPGAAVLRVEIDPEHWFPDVERGNNVWAGGR